MFAPNKYGDGRIVIINLFSADWLGQRVQSSRSTVRVLAAGGFFTEEYFSIGGGAAGGVRCVINHYFYIGGCMRHALPH
jgi:hypothetical protein